MIITFDRTLGVLSRTIKRTTVMLKKFLSLRVRELDIQKIMISLTVALRALIIFVRTRGVLLRTVDRLAKL